MSAPLDRPVFVQVMSFIYKLSDVLALTQHTPPSTVPRNLAET